MGVGEQETKTLGELSLPQKYFNDPNSPFDQVIIQAAQSCVTAS